MKSFSTDLFVMFEPCRLNPKFVGNLFVHNVTELKKLKTSKSNSMMTAFTTAYQSNITKGQSASQIPASVSAESCDSDLYITRGCAIVPSSSFCQCTPVNHGTQTFRSDLYISGARDRVCGHRSVSNTPEPCDRDEEQLSNVILIKCRIKSFLCMSKLLACRKSHAWSDSPTHYMQRDSETKSAFEERRRVYPRTILDIALLQADLDCWMNRELNLLQEATPKRELRKLRLRVLSESISRRKRIKVFRSESLEYRSTYVRVGKQVIEIINEERKRRVELYNRLSVEPPEAVCVRIKLLDEILKELECEDDEVKDLATLLGRELRILRSHSQTLSHMSGLRLRIRNRFFRYLNPSSRYLYSVA